MQVAITIFLYFGTLGNYCFGFYTNKNQIQTEISDLVGTTGFWNNLPQVGTELGLGTVSDCPFGIFKLYSISKDWKTKVINNFRRNKAKGPKSAKVTMCEGEEPMF